MCMFNMCLFFSILKSIEFSTSEESGGGEKMVCSNFFIVYTVYREHYVKCYFYCRAVITY